MMAAVLLVAPVAEFYRLSLFDQALARATHEGARAAAAADPSQCQQAITDAFNSVDLAVWLLDRNDDRQVTVANSDGWPTGAEEVHTTIVADPDLFIEDDEVEGCGAAGTNSWILVRTRIVVEPWFGPLQLIWPDGIQRQQESSARNQV